MSHGCFTGFKQEKEVIPLIIIIVIIIIIIVIVIIRLWGIRHLEVVPVVVGALGVVSKRLDAWLEKLGVTIRMGLLQKTALLGTARILRKVLDS